MAGDKNVYALTVDFTISDSAAMTSLADIGRELTTIEDQVRKVSTGGFKIWQSDLGAYHDQLKTVSALHVGINNSMAQALPSLAAATAQHGMHGDLLGKEASGLKGGMLPEWKKIIESLEQKEKLLTTESDILKKEEGLVSAVGKSMAKWLGYIKGASDAMFSYLGSLLDVMGAIRECNVETEKFHTANFRLYGSQQQLMDRSASLAGTMGALTSQTVAAYVALANIKAPKEQIESLIKTNVMMARVSGASNIAVADFQRSLISAGFGADGANKATEKLAQSMRTLGINTRDAEAVMSKTASSMAAVSAVMGKAAAADLPAAMVAVHAFGRESGWTDGQTAGLAEAIADVSFQARNMRSAMSGIEIKTPTDNLRALNIQMLELRQGMIDAGDSQDDIDLGLKIFAKQMKVTEDVARAMKMSLDKGFDEFDEYAKKMEYSAVETAALRSQMEKLIGAGKSADAAFHEVTGTVDKAAAAADNLAKLYADANNNMMTAMMNTKGAFSALWMQLFILVEPILRALVQAIGWVAETLNKFLACLKTGEGGVAAFGNGIAALGALVGGIVVGFLAWKAVTLAFAAVIKAVLGPVAQVIGDAIGKVLGGLADGLEKLRDKQTIMLSLGLTLIMVAAAMLIVAFAIKLVAEVGPDAWGAMLMLAIIIVVMAVAIGVLAFVAVKAALPLLALGVAFLMLGVTALMVAAALYIIALAMEKMTIGGALTLLVVAITLIAVGVAMMYAGSSLAIGAAGVLVGAGLFWLASLMLVPAIRNFEPVMELFTELSSALLIFGLAMGAAALFGVLGAGALIIVGGLLWLASKSMWFGLRSMAGNSPLMILVGHSLLLFAVGLTAASGAISSASAVFTRDGVALQSSMTALAGVLGKMGDVASGAASAGSGLDLFAAGLTTATAALELSAAGLSGLVAKFDSAVAGLAATVGQLGRVALDAQAAATQLTAAAGDLDAAGVAMASAADSMLAGGIGLARAAGGSIMAVFGLRFVAGGLVRSAEVIAPAAQSLAQAGAALEHAGEAIMRGRETLVGAGRDFAAVAQDLSGTGQDMISAANFILFAALTLMATAAMAGDAGLGGSAEGIRAGAAALRLAISAAGDAGLGRFAEGVKAGAATLSAASLSVADSSLALTVATTRLHDALEFPELDTALTSLQEARAVLGTELSGMAGEFSAQADIIEAASARMASAIMRAAPPVGPGKLLGGLTYLVAQSLTTTRVKDEGGSFDDRQYHRQHIDAEREQNKRLVAIEEVLVAIRAKLGPDGSEDIKAIKDLLEEYLPEIAEQSGDGLAGKFNQWSR